MINSIYCFALSLLFLVPGAAMTIKNPQEENATNKPWRQALSNYGDLQYYGTIDVGDQKLHGVFDTGSIELVVLSDKCNYWCGEAEKLYHSKESSFYEKGTLSISMSYGSGDLRGGEAYDTVSIGPFRAENTPFWEVSDATMPVLLESDFEAIIGLGPIAENLELLVPGKPKTNLSYALVLDNLKLYKYSVCLMRDPGMPAFLTWNEDIHYRHPKIFTALNISGTSYWTVKLENVQLGSGTPLCKSGCGAIIDSGTSLLAMPDHALNSMIRLINRLGANCHDLAALPNLNFMLDGVKHSLPPDAYLGRIHGNAPHYLTAHFEKQSTSCQAALMKVQIHSNFGETWILGMPFFRSYLTVFDQTNRKQPQLFTTRASDECTPLGLGLGLNSQGLRVARTIDASKLRLPTWARGNVHAHTNQVRQTHLGEAPVLHHKHKAQKKHDVY